MRAHGHSRRENGRDSQTTLKMARRAASFSFGVNTARRNARLFSLLYFSPARAGGEILEEAEHHFIRYRSVRSPRYLLLTYTLLHNGEASTTRYRQSPTYLHGQKMIADENAHFVSLYTEDDEARHLLFISRTYHYHYVRSRQSMHYIRNDVASLLVTPMGDYADRDISRRLDYQRQQLNRCRLSASA